VWAKFVASCGQHFDGMTETWCSSWMGTLKKWNHVAHLQAHTSGHTQWLPVAGCRMFGF
jgi:hypothetical protein